MMKYGMCEAPHCGWRDMGPSVLTQAQVPLIYTLTEVRWVCLGCLQAEQEEQAIIRQKAACHSIYQTK